MPDPQQIVPVGGAMPIVGIGEEVPQSGAAPTPDVQAPEQPSWLGSAMSFAEGVGSQINPIEIAKGIYGAITSPIETVKGLGQAQVDQFKKGKELYDQGRYSEAVGHALAGALPLVGPAAANIGEDIGAGNVAHGLGATAGLIGTVTAPSLVKPAVKALSGSGVAERVAGAAERGATTRMVDVMAPKVGANKVRFGNMARDVAPTVAADPGMGALSRRGLAEKIGNKLSEAEAQLDAANDARNPNELIDTRYVTLGLEDKLRKLTAEPAEGPAAHAAAADAGYRPEVPKTVPMATKFSELPPVYQAEIRRLKAEMEEFPFVDRTWKDTEGEVAREGGFGTGRGARNRTMAAAKREDMPFIEGAAGTPIYGEILAGKSGTTRNAMIRSMANYIEKDALPTSLVQRVVNLADKRIRDPKSVSASPFPLEDFLPIQDGPLGKSVIPSGFQDRASQIVQALKEVRALGPMATYDSLRKIRQAWDIPAKQKYVPSITQDFLKKSGESAGAADVTGTLREVLSAADPTTAAANKNYAFWRKADDVSQAANEVERVRPTVGRKIMARFAGMIAGGKAAGTVGELIGLALGPLVDSAIGTVSEGRKIIVARVMSDVASALRSGDLARVELALKKARAMSLITGAAGRNQ